MDKFTASTGYTVNGYTSSIIIRDRGGFVANDLGKYSAGAVREFVQSERDEELGRWRWPENPDYVVYPHGNDAVRVIDERSAVAETLYRAGDERQPLLATGGGMDAARAYFTAHPERKDWEDAKHGEVWLIAIDGEAELPMVVDRETTSFPRFMEPIDAMSYGPRAGITAARRIWPEVS